MTKDFPLMLDTTQIRYDTRIKKRLNKGKEIDKKKNVDVRPEILMEDM